MQQLVALLKRWIEILVALATGFQEQWRTEHALRISSKDGVFMVRGSGPEHALLATVPAGKAFPDNARQAAEKGFVILELPPTNLVVRHINVPARAQEYMSGIVRNRLDQLSPWKPEQATYGYEARPSADDANSLDVRVFITSRAEITAAREAMGAAGMKVDRIVVPDIEAKPDDKNAHNITLWSRLTDVTEGDAPGQTQLRRLIAGGITATAAISVAVSGWALYSAHSLDEEYGALLSRTRAMQGQLQAARSSANTGSLTPARRAWVEKETFPSTALTLDALSRVLPTTAYLTDFDLQNTTLRIIGLAGDAPGLIAPMEQSGHFVNVHFFAPTTRGPDGTLYKFHVEARVQPGLEGTK